MSWKLHLLAKENVRVEIDGITFLVKPVTSLQKGLVLSAWNAMMQLDGWKHTENGIDAITSLIADVEHPEFDPKNRRDFVKRMPPDVMRQLMEQLAMMTLDEFDRKNSDALPSGDSNKGMNQQESRAAQDVNSATANDVSI